jgi:hypothetical protein
MSYHQPTVKRQSSDAVRVVHHVRSGLNRFAVSKLC